VGVLVGAIDVQGDRLEAVVKGYGAMEESWLIAVHQEYGDPARADVWVKMDAFLRSTFRHASGREMRLECVTVDAQFHSEQVYRFCKARAARRVFAVRGGTETGKPVVGRPSVHNRYRAKLWTLCVDAAKEAIMSRLRIQAPGPGFVHLPEWVDAEYCEQLTAEKGVRKYLPGRGVVRQWIKTRERNEALDLEVYCLAALYILGPVLIRSLPERAAKLSASIEPAPVSEDASSGPSDAPAVSRAEEALRRRSRRKSGWMERWKK
jgi:phage terminase large subunit GpA-like protein